MYIWSIDLTRVTRLLNEKSIIFSTNGPGTTRYTFKMRNLYQLKLSVNYESEIKTFLKFFYYYFLAVLHTSWDPSSPTRGLWHMQRKHGGLTTRPPGKSLPRHFWMHKDTKFLLLSRILVKELLRDIYLEFLKNSIIIIKVKEKSKQRSADLLNKCFSKTKAY